jgi:hypothetical protein
MVEEAETKRVERVKTRALESLALASLPERMKLHAETSKEKLSQNLSADNLNPAAQREKFKARPAPKFKEVDLEEARKNWPKKITKVIPFAFIGEQLQKTKEEERTKAASLEPIAE